jgi:iron-sulfur cluster repair protein YtfE (RIC family)
VDKIDSLIEEPATLRRLVDRIEQALGGQMGVGWDDCLCGDMSRFCAAQLAFQDRLKEHEAKEERLIGALLRCREAERAELEPVIERAHASLDGTLALLHTLSRICDGEHVYAVRTMAGRLREELEAHLTHEEKVLFPLLRGRPMVVGALQAPVAEDGEQQPQGHQRGEEEAA